VTEIRALCDAVEHRADGPSSAGDDVAASTPHPVLEQTSTLFAGLEEFRQHLGGRLTLTMLNDIGRPLEVHDVDREQMKCAITRVADFAASSRAAPDIPRR
jgi:3-dehydroquinate synthase